MLSGAVANDAQIVLTTVAVMAVAIPLLAVATNTAPVAAGIELIDIQTTRLIGRPDAKITAFVGSLFIFIFVSGWSMLLPAVIAPTASLSTVAALSAATMVYAYMRAARKRGLKNWLKSFARPSVFFAPMNVLTEFTKGVSLALRLFGNMMGGAFLIALSVALAPIFLPALMNLYGLIAATLQPYIFMTLATVYIGAAAGDFEQKRRTKWMRKQA